MQVKMHILCNVPKDKQVSYELYWFEIFSIGFFTGYDRRGHRLQRRRFLCLCGSVCRDRHRRTDLQSKGMYRDRK